VYNSNLIVRVYSHWVNTANALWVYMAIGCIILLPVTLALWVYIRIGCIMRTGSLLYCGYIMRYTLPAFPETKTTATLVLVCETLWSSFLHCSRSVLLYSQYIKI